MNERPIIYSAPSICAILEDRKIKTRRPIKADYEKLEVSEGINGHPFVYEHGHVECDGCEYSCGGKEIFCPYGQPGDRLWVRETFCMVEGDKFAPGGIPMPIIYRADETRYGGKRMKQHNIRWTSSIFMPRKVSRITLEIVSIRVERLREIEKDESLNELEAEGFDASLYVTRDEEDLKDLDVNGMLGDFENLWNKLNAKRGFSWESNPWVWVVEFKRIKEGAPT